MAITLDGSNGITTDISSNESATFNRDTTNGDLIVLQKDNATVGTIGTGDPSGTGNLEVESSSNNLYLTNRNSSLVYRDNGSGSRWFAPYTTGTISLGDTTNQWRNLYLSGGAYLGGTGAANYLDDYEEGTWTPAPNAGSWSGDNVSGHYVKVGRMVSIIVDIRNVSIDASASTSNVIKNLPFTNGGKRSACSQATYYNTFDNVNVAGIIETNNTQIIFVQIQASGAWLTSNFRNANNSYIQLFATYYTDY